MSDDYQVTIRPDDWQSFCKTNDDWRTDGTTIKLSPLRGYFYACSCLWLSVVNKNNSCVNMARSMYWVFPSNCHIQFFHEWTSNSVYAGFLTLLVCRRQFLSLLRWIRWPKLSTARNNNLPPAGFLCQWRGGLRLKHDFVTISIDWGVNIA